MTSGFDWTRVQSELCPECRFDPADHRPATLPTDLSVVADGWQRVLGEDPGALRRRPAPAAWSPIELGCHVRDVLRVFDERIVRTAVEDEPVLGWWDHEAAAIDEGYRDQAPAVVAASLHAAALGLGTTLAGIPAGDAWARQAIRREGEVFTLGGMARFALHEAVHHLRDARLALGRR